MSELEVRGDVFNPLETYGDYVELEVPRSELPDREVARIFRILKDDMEGVIPPEYRNKVGYIEHDATDDGLLPSWGWKYRGGSES